MIVEVKGDSMYCSITFLLLWAFIFSVPIGVVYLIKRFWDISWWWLILAYVVWWVLVTWYVVSGVSLH